MLIKQIRHIFDTQHFQEDLRKLGINLITAGTASLFVTHIAGLTRIVVSYSIWLIAIGLLTTILGLYTKKS